MLFVNLAYSDDPSDEISLIAFSSEFLKDFKKKKS